MSSLFYAAGLLVSATGSALLRKVLFQLSSVGAGGEIRRFEKPWFTTFESALACWFSLFLFALSTWVRRQPSGTPVGSRPVREPLLQETISGDTNGKNGATMLVEVEHNPSATLIPSWHRISPLLLPAAFHMLSIIIQGEGLRYVTASVSQMISGSCIIFTAILSVTVLKCRLNWLHVTGIGLSLVGIVAVSLVSVLFPAPHPSLPAAGQALQLAWPDPPGTLLKEGVAPSEMALGVGLTLLSMLVLALRLILEEMVVGEGSLHPMEVMGYEGILGTLMMLFIGLPIAWILPGNDPGGREENTWDSLYMLWNSGSLSAVNAGFFFSVVGLNVFGLFVTQMLGSVFRAVLLTARTATVWAVNLSLYALHVGGGTVGEPWLTPASWLQLLGFSVLLTGTIVYGQGSSVAALEQVNIGDILEEAGQSQNVNTVGDLPDETRPDILNRMSMARVGSIARLHPTSDAHDSIMIPRTRMLVNSPSVAASVIRGAAAASLQAHPLSSLPSSFEDDIPETSLRSPNSRPASDGISMRSRRSPGEGPGFLETLVHPGSWVNSPASRLLTASSFGPRVRNLARRSMGPPSVLDEESQYGDSTTDWGRLSDREP